MDWNRVGSIGRMLVGGAALAGAGLFSTMAQAGVPECNGMRVETAGSCEVVVSASCGGQCELDVYEKACATELRTVCGQECSEPPGAQCTTDCGEICEADCANGVSLICVHNCFDECTGTCSDACVGAEDPEQCRASCEATCNGECDDQCAIVDPDDSCMTHCLECCDGSCRAIANMDCQITCQEEEFESCEYGMEAECDGGCSADGSLFCDGEYVMSGWGIRDCVEALMRRGIDVDLQVDLNIPGVDASVDVDLDPWEPGESGGSFCSIADDPGTAVRVCTLMMLGLLGMARHRFAP